MNVPYANITMKKAVYVKVAIPVIISKTKNAKKINIPHCLEVDELDEKKCTRCLKRLSEPVDGKCVAPKTWVI